MVYGRIFIGVNSYVGVRFFAAQGQTAVIVSASTVIVSEGERSQLLRRSEVLRCAQNDGQTVVIVSASTVIVSEGERSQLLRRSGADGRHRERRRTISTPASE
jgi:hypothetical protein